MLSDLEEDMRVELSSQGSLCNAKTKPIDYIEHYNVTREKLFVH